MILTTSPFGYIASGALAALAFGAAIFGPEASEPTSQSVVSFVPVPGPQGPAGQQGDVGRQGPKGPQASNVRPA